MIKFNIFKKCLVGLSLTFLIGISSQTLILKIKLIQWKALQQQIKKMVIL